MADGKKDDSFSLADARARLANRLGRVSRQHQEWRDFGVSYDESVYSDETKSMRSIHQSDVDRRDFGAPDAPPHGVIETCDQNRDSMLDDSDGKKGVQVPSAGPAVQPVPVAVSAPLAPGAAGGDSPGVAGTRPSPRGIDEILAILREFTKNQQKFQQFLTKKLILENGAKECIV